MIDNTLAHGFGALLDIYFSLLYVNLTFWVILIPPTERDGFEKSFMLIEVWFSTNRYNVISFTSYASFPRGIPCFLACASILVRVYVASAAWGLITRKVLCLDAQSWKENPALWRVQYCFCFLWGSLHARLFLFNANL